MADSRSLSDHSATCGHGGDTLYGRCISCIAAERDRYGEALREIRAELGAIPARPADHAVESRVGIAYHIARSALEQTQPEGTPDA